MRGDSRRANQEHLPRQAKQRFIDGKYRWLILIKLVFTRVSRPMKQLNGSKGTGIRGESDRIHLKRKDEIRELFAT